MLNNLLSKRIFICIFVFLICGVVSVYFLRPDLPEEPLKIYTPVEPTPKPKAEAPVRETEQDGHIHEDGTWHEGAHEEVDDTPVQPTQPPAPRGTPFANFKPDPNDDPVSAAYKRLDYIANNLNEWGAFSPETLEIIDELTPVPVISVEAEGYREIEFLEALCELRDPRSAEILVRYQVYSPVNGVLPDETLVALGPAAVPALVAELEEKPAREAMLHTPITLLPRIVAEHRSALGGIVEHIIIPKLQAIATLEGDDYILVNRISARRSLAELQQ